MEEGRGGNHERIRSVFAKNHGSYTQTVIVKLICLHVIIRNIEIFGKL